MGTRDQSFATTIVQALQGGSKVVLLVGAHHLKPTGKRKGAESSPGISTLLSQSPVPVAHATIDKS